MSALIGYYPPRIRVGIVGAMCYCTHSMVQVHVGSSNALICFYFCLSVCLRRPHRCDVLFALRPIVTTIRGHAVRRPRKKGSLV